jgi:hypothetical protein
MVMLLTLYIPGTLGLIIVAGALILYLFRQYRPHKTEEAQYAEQVRKSELARVISTRKDRELLECMEEDKFWELIEKSRGRAKPGYKSRLGVLSLILSNQMNEEDLLRFDNLHMKLIRENINFDLRGASTIIFGNEGIDFTVLLMNIFMFEGEVFFKNASINPNLFIGKQVEEVIGQTIEETVAELYFKKTNNLIPVYKSEEGNREIDGEPWEPKDLPSRYPELWEAFA